MRKVNYTILILLVIFLTSISFVSAGFLDWFKEITGEAGRTVGLNISIGSGNVPVIKNVTIISAVTLEEGPENSTIIVNFTVSDADGADNLDDSTAHINFTKSGEYNRTVLCQESSSGGTEANYTCNVTMWWFDADGTWTINASISDLSSNNATNDTTSFTVNPLTGLKIGPDSLTFSSINAGATNSTSNNDPIIINNTGNQDIASNNIQINATDLIGESDSGKILFAGNFSVGNFTSGNKEECDITNNATIMNDTSGSIFTNISGTILPHGNYTKEDGTAQEQLFVCLLLAGSELSQQAYSTDSAGAWTIQI